MLNNVCLLATEHNITKAYLEALYHANLIPSKIIYVHNDITTELSLYVKLKVKIKRYIKHLKTRPNNEKNKQYLDELNYVSPFIKHELKKNNLVTPDYMLSTLNHLKQKKCTFQSIYSPSINDEKLASLVSSIKEEYVIFCGGGILKSNMFKTGKKFIHVHPGVVPSIKGADCLLWSVLERKRIGMSAFFMNEGIDTGDILITKEYDLPKINVSDKSKLNYEHIPHILINHLDPSYRADALISCFKTNTNPSKWAYAKQDPEQGKYFHFMHKSLAQVAAQKLFAK